MAGKKWTETHRANRRASMLGKKRPDQLRFMRNTMAAAELFKQFGKLVSMNPPEPVKHEHPITSVWLVQYDEYCRAAMEYAKGGDLTLFLLKNKGVND
jgi:hypothetical protein